MLPRAFVVMPFGVKRLDPFDGASPSINFDRVYENLLRPALIDAGFDAFREDNGSTAGDIRTDMFFELVTADLVVTDISVPNANVFYELGIRHGVSPRGAIMVRAKEATVTPFDISPDRYFEYDPRVFLEADDSIPSEALDAARKQLSQRFKRAVEQDPRTTASPVYSHLAGLKEVKWDGLVTARAKYFGGLESDWRQRVRRAQEADRPGDILTLAADAPTRIHASKILYEAAIALIDIGRYDGAARVLEEVIHNDPSHLEAQMQHALVLIRLNRTREAEEELEKLVEHEDYEPRVLNLRGQVKRHLWRLSWSNLPQPERKERARQRKAAAIEAIDCFVRAHQFDPKLYFAGFNALMLDFVLRAIAPATFPKDDLVGGVARDELTTVVGYTATNVLTTAKARGNYDDRFWCTTTLAGIDFMSGNPRAALDKIEDACSLRAPTTFQLQSFQGRLQLLSDLGVGEVFVEEALGIVNRELNEKLIDCGCERVFVWLGASSMRREQMLEPLNGDWLASTLENRLKTEQMSPNDLGICAGTTESDIVFAETCLSIGARIRVMRRSAVGNERDEFFWPFASEAWRRRWEALIAPGVHKEIWRDDEYLGSIPDGVGSESADQVASRRQREWLLHTVRMEAEPARVGAAGTTRRVYLLLLGDRGDDRHPSGIAGRHALSERIQMLGDDVRIISIDPGATVRAV